jgi:energy-coupling factor transporter transmembrane protein EcfT
MGMQWIPNIFTIFSVYKLLYAFIYIWVFFYTCCTRKKPKITLYSSLDSAVPTWAVWAFSGHFRTWPATHPPQLMDPSDQRYWIDIPDAKHLFASSSSPRPVGQDRRSISATVRRPRTDAPPHSLPRRGPILWSVQFWSKWFRKWSDPIIFYREWSNPKVVDPFYTSAPQQNPSGSTVHEFEAVPISQFTHGMN